MEHDSLSQEVLMDLYSKRPNFGTLENKTHSADHENTSCDDTLHIELKIKNGVIEDAKFSETTCFVSIVSAEALVENLKGMKLEDAKKLSKEDIDSFLGVKISETRIKCELLALEAFKKAI